LAESTEDAGFRIRRQPDDKGILFHHRRQLDDGQILFLVNTSIDSPSAGAIESDLAGVEQWNLYTGQVEAYPFTNTQKGIGAEFSLPPAGSLLLFLSKGPRQPAPAVSDTVSVLKAEAAPSVRRLQPNVLTLDYVDVTAGGQTKTNIYFYPANQYVWKQNGLERDPWDSAVQFRDELISKKFPANSGFEASYKFTVEGKMPANLAIVIERPDLYTVTCNGQPVKAKPNDWWLDKAFGRVPIAAAARAGENVVTIKAAPLTMFHELESAYVLGDFSLKPVERGFVVGPERPLGVGDWRAQGLPLYNAGVAYRERIKVKTLSGRYAVALTNWCGSVAKVTVNGRPVGFIDAPPWECDVTGWLKRGENDIEVTVIGTLKNTLGPHHGNPALGAAWPANFQKAPQSGPPPGVQYSTVAYGLFEPFVLKHRTWNDVVVTR
jgi:hypothetical protein